MKKGITWCPHCGEPHTLDTSVCPTTNKPLLKRLHTAGVAKSATARAAPSSSVMRAAGPAAGGLIIGGRYQVIRRIGRGGMGEVFEARDLSLLRPVALKVVSRATPEARTRLEREGKLIASLHHPNICDVFDVGTLEDGVPYLVLERLQGETLAALMRRRRRAPVAVAIEIFSQVLSALQCAHSRGVVHRDMKPANVFIVTRPNGGQLVKLLDFGLAKDLFDTTSAGMTKPGRAVGTPAYMSPEQLVGAPVDGRSDLFSVGLMLFEALTGKHPFAGPRATVAETASNIVNGTHPDLDALRAVPPRLRSLVHAALEKDPRKRPLTAIDFQTALVAIEVWDESAVADASPVSTGSVELPRLHSSNDSASSMGTGSPTSSPSLDPPSSVTWIR